MLTLLDPLVGHGRLYGRLAPLTLSAVQTHRVGEEESHKSCATFLCVSCPRYDLEFPRSSKLYVSQHYLWCGNGRIHSGGQGATHSTSMSPLVVESSVPACWMLAVVGLFIIQGAAGLSPSIVMLV